MPKVRLFHGKPILCNGKVAIADECCCGPQTGACCISGICGDGYTEPGCIEAGGTFQGVGTRCTDVDCHGPGSCCLPDNSCVVETLADCEAAGGTFGGYGTDCIGVDCTCCPFFAHYTTIRFSGSITDGTHGCAFVFSEKTWTKVTFPTPLSAYTFTISGSPCAFTSEDCNTGVDTTYVRLGNDDSSSPCFPDAILTADFSVPSGGRCGPTVQLGGTSTAMGCVSGGTNDFTEYDLSSGSLSVMIPDSLFPSIIYTFNLSVS